MSTNDIHETIYITNPASNPWIKLLRQCDLKNGRLYYLKVSKSNFKNPQRQAIPDHKSIISKHPYYKFSNSTSHFTFEEK